ncbi:hypothetical protein [Streptomyces sp. NPDC059533]|uniref:hypothetical protein n=1 Tax=unclassified Streptomyces TaxID=2593676 RepID=UPI0036C76F5A
MIGRVWAVLRLERRSCTRLVPVLVMLVAAHLAGATHTAAFAGPHTVSQAIACPQQHAAQGPAVTPEPPHEHDSDSHVDHAVDRPRPNGSCTAAVSAFSELPAADHVVALEAPAGATPWCTGPPGGPAPRTLSCVSRQ